MIQRKKFLILISFDEILSEFETYTGLLWFYERGFKSLVELIIGNLSLLDRVPFTDLDIEKLFIELWGDPLVNIVKNDFHASLEHLDRCNSNNVSVREDEILIQYVVTEFVNAIEKHLATHFKHDVIWDQDYDCRFLWRGNNLLFTIIN